MLAYADAALIDTTLTVAQRARVERLLREFDPADVLWLSVIDRVAGTFFEKQQATQEARMRWEVWNKAGADILVAAGCIRVTHHSGGIGAAGWDGVEVTHEGRLVLHAMRLFVRATEPPMIPPGTGPRPGDCTAHEAWRVLDAVRGLREAAIRIAARTPHVRYDFPKLDSRDAKPPAHDAKAILYLYGATPEEAGALIPAAPMQHDPMRVNVGMPVDRVELQSKPDDFDPAKRMMLVHGPHDVLRWLADDVEARWT